MGGEHHPQPGQAEEPRTETLGALLSPKLPPEHHRVTSPRSRRYPSMCCAALVLGSKIGGSQWLSQLKN